jgi:long-chain acyl-CoA synthetase
MSYAARIARERPDEIALADPEKQFGWKELDESLNRGVERLRETDLGEERRIAVYASNSAETVIAHLCGLLAGASVVPVNFHLSTKDAAWILRDSGARLLFVGPEEEERGCAAAEAAGIPVVIGWRCAARPGLTPFLDWLGAATGKPPPEDHPPRPNLMYTSGTTGFPKGTELPPTMFGNSRSIREFCASLSETPWAKYGRHLVVGPLYHTGPLGSLRILGGGVPIVILDRFDAEATLEAIERFRIESSVMVPTHFIRLLDLPSDIRRRYDLSSLRRIYHTGAACPIDVKRKMLEWWGPVIHEAYGATEVGTTCRISPEEWLAHPGSVGKPNPPFTVRIVDEDGKQVPPGTTGRLYFHDATGRGVVYHRNPQQSAAAHLEPGVFTLGEIGHVDENGYLYITDRFSDMVVSGGVNLYPAEAERVLADHPAILDVACVGVPHPEMGEELIAIVQPSTPEAPPTAAELLDYCRRNLSSYKCPRRIYLRKDLTRTAMGKLDKRRLQEEYRDATESP